MRYVVAALLITIVYSSKGQGNAMYKNLPVGKYVVGFRIVTITDSTRVTKPLINYFGEKETGDRYRQLTIHIWYPAKANTGSGAMNFADYCYSDVLKSTVENIPGAEKKRNVDNARGTIERFFGKITDDKWNEIAQTKMMAFRDASPVKEKFPLLIGMLRPLSTTITNEMLASNGYVVAMVVGDGSRWPIGFIADVTDMQNTISYMDKVFSINADSIGTFGFSGSGFSQLLLAMNDPRIAAYADMESALYGQGVAEYLSSSGYYDTDRMTKPFLHIYGTELAKSDVAFADFLKQKYSRRYHLSLNFPGLHHWDIATEGRVASALAHLRRENENGVKSTFELCNIYLFHFFNATLKNMAESEMMLNDRSKIKGYPDSLWAIKSYTALRQPPDRKQFGEYINRNGIVKGLQLARDFQKQDSNTAFIHENDLNRLSQEFAEKKKMVEAIDLMKLAVEFYPTKPWLWNNLASTEEDSGNSSDAVLHSEKVLELLKDYKGEALSFDNRIRKSAEERLKRLKK